ncbi:hypothetical protein JXD38_08065 [candidate division WOR-3 bacterium]|nr:hypothetical protein [candidate division WOR-3 bacterium]
MQNADVWARPFAAVVLAAVAAAALAGCDWLLEPDTVPPTCQITSPVDSSSVTGTVTTAATAYDSVGVDRVEFYADGALVGIDSSAPYSASWDATSQSEGTWHSLSCIAYDVAENQGYSDTVVVVIGAIGPTSVYHGELEVTPGVARWLYFRAATGDTLTGDLQVVSGGTLTRFAWLDSVNHRKFLNSEPYDVVFEANSFAQASVSQAAAAAGKQYLLFVNDNPATVKCWVRLVLE